MTARAKMVISSIRVAREPSDGLQSAEWGL